MLSPTLLGGLSPQQFLEEYWQKKPLLVRGAFPDWENPLTPEELAGLACEAGVESRLVLEKGGRHPWEVRHGPFDEAEFADFPESHWTLLVQDVDKHVPELADLLEAFRFVPDWRIDDLMISYAPSDGSVGPHVDAYDVFLLQGLGERRWQISDTYTDECIADVELRILREFTTEQEWTLHPGDMLYLPPGVAHYGVAMNDCMTYSIGFRAPSRQELIHGFLDDVLAGIDSQTRYADPDLPLQSDAAMLTDQSLKKLRSFLIEGLPLDEDSLNRWLGRYLSEPKEGFEPYAAEITADTQHFVRRWTTERVLLRNSACRFLLMDAKDGHRLIFVNGQEYPVLPRLATAASRLCNQRLLDIEAFRDALKDASFADLLCHFFNLGYLYFDEQH